MIFELADEHTDFPVIGVTIRTPVGIVLAIGNYARRGRVVMLTGVHVQGESTNRLGPGQVRAIVMSALEEFDLDAIEIAGGVRSNGATPGRTPKPLRFVRRR